MQVIKNHISKEDKYTFALNELKQLFEYKRYYKKLKDMM